MGQRNGDGSIRLYLALRTSEDPSRSQSDATVEVDVVRDRATRYFSPAGTRNCLRCLTRSTVEHGEVVVQPHAAVLELADSAQAAPGALGPDRGGEAVLDVVRPGDRLVVVGEPLHGDDRAEDLLLDDLRALLGAGDDRGLDEEARGCPSRRRRSRSSRRRTSPARGSRARAPAGAARRPGPCRCPRSSDGSPTLIDSTWSRAPTGSRRRPSARRRRASPRCSPGPSSSSRPP